VQNTTEYEDVYDLGGVVSIRRRKTNPRCPRSKGA
jgi:hypothetical protein